ncbi:hypothetical protein Tco_1553464 [Tanacetum coccineum]
MCSYLTSPVYMYVFVDVCVQFHGDANFNDPEIQLTPTSSKLSPLPPPFHPFTSSSSGTHRFDKTKGYSCQLDEQRFYLTKATLRDALQLPQDNNNFTPPSNANTIISFVNELGYPNVIRTLSGVVTNDTYQPWRALATIINLCLMGKTSAFERPRAQVLQILWGVVNKANIDYERKSTSSQPPKPKHVPAKPQEKKRKLATDATEAPSPAKRLKAGKVLKKRTLKSSRQLVDEFIDEGVPADEPRFSGERGEEESVRNQADSEPSGLVETSSLYAELGLTVSETDSDEEVSPEMNAKAQEEGQGGTNPRDAGVSQTPSSHVVHAGPKLDHMDLGIAKASSQPNIEQMDEEFTAMAYPKFQMNLKLLTEGDVRLEDPASLAATLSSFSISGHGSHTLGHLFSSSNNPPVIDLTVSQPASITRIGELERSIADQVDASRLEGKEILLQRMLEENYDKGQEDHRMAYEALQKSIIRDESDQFDADKVEERKKMKSKQDSPKTPPEPPPPPPSSNDQSSGSAVAGSSKTAATTAYTAWTMTTSRFEPSASFILEDVFMHEESDFEAQDMVFDDEDIGSRHVPRVNLNQDWFKPLSKDERPATPEPAWSIPSSSLLVPIHNWASALASSYKQGITELTPEHLEGPAYEVVKAFHPDVIHLQFQMEECHKLLTNQVDDRLLRYNVSRPLPLGGPLGQVTIQIEFFFNKDLDYLLFGSKGDRLALSITNMKAAYYPDAGLE